MSPQSRTVVRLAFTLCACGVVTSICPQAANAQAVRPSAPTRNVTVDRDEITRAALDYVEGFYEGDSVKFARSVRPEFFKFGFEWSRDSAKYVGEHMSWSEALSYIRRFKKNGRPTAANAPKRVDLLDVQDQTASAKLTAWWGVDYLLLARYDGRWMISSVMWQSPPVR